MPHIDIKYFPVDLELKRKEEFIQSLTLMMKKTFGVDEKAISITMEPVESNNWDEKVYQPEIVNRKQWICKRPGYGALAENNEI